MSIALVPNTIIAHYSFFQLEFFYWGIVIKIQYM